MICDSTHNIFYIYFRKDLYKFIVNLENKQQSNSNNGFQYELVIFNELMKLYFSYGKGISNKNIHSLQRQVHHNINEINTDFYIGSIGSDDKSKNLTDNNIYDDSIRIIILVLNH